ncbi:MAG: ABC transporter substrate-binding protein [Actinomycetota bacterium]|nr:MAG: ABC transporter substrate-binding protein [Actinomycetota bacterium]
MNTNVSANAQERSGRRRRTKRLATVSALLAVPVIVAACGSSDNSGGSNSGAAVAPLVFANASYDVSQALIYVAQYGGYFKQQGVDVTVNMVGSAVATSLTSGQADIAGSGGSQAFAITNQGKDTTQLFWTLSGKAVGFMIAKAEIKSPTECKTLVTSVPGGSAYGWAVAYKKAYNATYDITGTADQTLSATGVASGKFDCAANTIGQFSPSVNAGKAHYIVDPRDPNSLPEAARNLENLGTSYFAMKNTIASKRESVVRFIKAINQAVEYVKTHTPEEVAAVLQNDTNYKAIDKTVLAGQIKDITFGYAPNGGFISKDAWASIIAFNQGAGLTYLSTTDPKWSYESNVDMSYWEAAKK